MTPEQAGGRRGRITRFLYTRAHTEGIPEVRPLRPPSAAEPADRPMNTGPA